MAIDYLSLILQALETAASAKQASSGASSFQSATQGPAAFQRPAEPDWLSPGRSAGRQVGIAATSLIPYAGSVISPILGGVNASMESRGRTDYANTVTKALADQLGGNTGMKFRPETNPTSSSQAMMRTAIDPYGVPGRVFASDKPVARGMGKVHDPFGKIQKTLYGGGGEDEDAKAANAEQISESQRVTGMRQDEAAMAERPGGSGGGQPDFLAMLSHLLQQSRGANA